MQVDSVTIKQLLANVIGGEERAGLSTQTMLVEAPATGEVIAIVPR